MLKKCEKNHFKIYTANVSPRLASINNVNANKKKVTEFPATLTSQMSSWLENRFW